MTNFWGVFSKIKDGARAVVDPIVSIWTDKTISVLDVKTDFGYGRVLYQIRERAISEGKDKYLMIEYRGTEGRIWVPVDKRNALIIAKFINDEFSKGEDI